MTEARPSRADLQRIRRLFADAQPSYGVAESAALLGLAEAEIRRELAEGNVAALQSGGETRIAWADLVWLGLMRRWTVRMLSDAVRGRRMPALVRVVPGTLELPRYQWRVLALLAEERRREEGRAWSASDLVEEAISDFILPSGDDWQSLEAVAPGLRAASEWPS